MSRSLFATRITNPPLPHTHTQVHHELTCSHKYTGDDGEEADQDGDRCGVCYKGKGRIDGGQQKGGKKLEDEERGGGMCPGCGEEEEIISSIQRRSEQRDEFLFACVCMFERGGMN